MNIQQVRNQLYKLVNDAVIPDLVAGENVLFENEQVPENQSTPFVVCTTRETSFNRLGSGYEGYVQFTGKFQVDVFTDTNIQRVGSLTKAMEDNDSIVQAIRDTIFTFLATSTTDLVIQGAILSRSINMGSYFKSTLTADYSYTQEILVDPA